MRVMKVVQCATFRLRRTVNRSGQKLDVKMALDPKERMKLLSEDTMYPDLEGLRPSPEYYKKCRNHGFAMVRQLGMPSFFMTISSRDYAWGHLLKALMKMVEKKQ
jgi:hypothetical protein